MVFCLWPFDVSMFVQFYLDQKTNWLYNSNRMLIKNETTATWIYFARGTCIGIVVLKGSPHRPAGCLCNYIASIVFICISNSRRMKFNALTQGIISRYRPWTQLFNMQVNAVNTIELHLYPQGALLCVILLSIKACVLCVLLNVILPRV